MPVKAAGEVAEIVESGVKYATFEDAVAAALDGQTIRLLSNYENSTGNVSIGNKDLTIDLNGKNLTITQISTMNALTIKNGSMSAEIDNWSSGNLGTLVVDNVKLNTTFFQWMPDDGVVLESGTTVTVSNPTSAQCFLRS